MVEIVDGAFDFGRGRMVFTADGAEDEEGRVRAIEPVRISGEEDVADGVDHGDGGYGGAATEPGLGSPEAGERGVGEEDGVAAEEQLGCVVELVVCFHAVLEMWFGQLP